MCGRFTLKAPAAQLAAAFHLPEWLEFPPRFNIAPSQSVAIARTVGEDQELVSLRWGLVPHWSKEPTTGLLNARAETAADRPAFRVPFRRRRCLVLADGFYEWAKTNGTKQPYYFRLKDSQPFAFAGLWDRWEKGDEPVETCALLTTAPNAQVRRVHDRMPVLLRPDDYAAWLDPKLQDPKALGELLRAYPAARMAAYPVSRWVNDPKHEGPRCVEPELKLSA